MKNHWKIVISVLFILSFSSVNMRAQNAYVFSSISYYESTGEVDLEVGVSVDYQAFLYYSPDVQTFLYEQNTQIGTTSGVNDFYLFLDLSRSAKANTNYSSETAAGVNVRYNNYWNSFTDMFNYQSFTPVDTTNSAAWFGPGPKVEFPEVYVWLGIVRSFITTPAPQLTIVLPTSGTLISQDSNSNSSLTVQAYSNYPGVVSWHGTVSYSTRVNSIPNGGIAHGPFDSYFNDTSNSGSQKTVTLPSVGGSVTSLSASLTFPGRTLPTTTSVSSVALISGIQGGIPDATITTELNRLYALLSGNTYNLMTGVAMVESAYHHYLPFTHYGQTGKWWPNESTNDYGLDCSHIGLMQPPVSMTYAFDWKANSYEGVMNRFSAALYRSVQLYNIDHTHNSNLELTPLQHEQNALCLYRLGNNEENRYWLPTADYQAYVITDKYKCTKYVEDVFTLKKN